MHSIFIMSNMDKNRHSSQQSEIPRSINTLRPTRVAHIPRNVEGGAWEEWGLGEGGASSG